MLFDQAARQALQRARRSSVLTLVVVERFCDELGLHPRELYGDAYDRAAFTYVAHRPQARAGACPFGRWAVMQQDPKRPIPRVLGEDESVPDWFVLEFCDQAIRRFRQELADIPGRDLIQEEQAQLRVVDTLASESQHRVELRDWTIGERRVRQLASDAIGLSLEFQYDHGYEPMGARWAAVRECLEGEQARELIAEQERKLAAEAASQGERTAEAEPARVDRDQPRTRGGGER